MYYCIIDLVKWRAISMKKLKTLARRALGLCLAALLVVPVLAAEPLTAKQRQVMLLYYAEGKNMREIGEVMGVDKSTVSRTIKRGEQRLQRCLRYGAEAYLRNMDNL